MSLPNKPSGGELLFTFKLIGEPIFTPAAWNTEVGYCVAISIIIPPLLLVSVDEFKAVNIISL